MTAKRTLVLGLIAVPYVLSSITAGSAMGAEYIYKVNKAILGAGQHEAETLKAKTSQTMSSTILGIKFEVACKGDKLDAGEEPVVTGGVPGTSARDKLEFSECEGQTQIGEGRKERCTGVTTVEGDRLAGEIVTVVKPTTEAGRLATKFSPVAEKMFATIRCDSLDIPFKGTTAMLDAPEKTEQVVGTLVAKSGAEEITEVQKSNGVKEKVGLECEGRLATFAGESELALTSNRSWGVF